ncbi:MAG: hypothetical protein SPK50_05910 [Mobiluncus porci]|uniref:hypothetical protein n=1 Tax=Mobiluncus porci TaxID=2652278 RepID=UPI0023F1D0EA|nr:hypothetical protein [Mobiluncus porci]MDD7541799.1 hypothetical protein [Mobiluncus porci]MDY5748647.1 hypothetical protein [Mobiluncus porci]
MNENPTRRNSHRAAGPVDDVPRPRPRRDLADSPRRRAKLAAQKLDAESGLAAAESGGASGEFASQLSGVSPGAADLFTKWLHENGFTDFESFQKMTRAAEQERTQQATEQPRRLTRREKRHGVGSLPPRVRSSPEPSRAGSGAPNPIASQPTPRTELAPPRPVRVASPRVEKEAVGNNALASELVTNKPVADEQIPTNPVAVEPAEKETTSSKSSDQLPSTAALKHAPTTRLTVGRRRAAKLRDKPRLPKPLSKTRKVPILLTLGILAFLAIAALVLVLWFQTRVVANDPQRSHIEVLGAVGAQPVLSLSEPLPLDKASTQILLKGTGKKVTVGRTVALRITVFSGLDGKLLSAGGDDSVLVGKLSPEVLGSEVYNTVQNATEGSRYLLKQPVKDKGTSRMEIGVIDVIPTELSGTMQPLPPESGIGISEENEVLTPSVSGEFTGDFRVDTLLDGKGATVSVGQTVLVRYLEYSFSNPPALLKDHWEEPVKLRLDGTLQSGVMRAIIDQKIGSRIVVQVPPAQGAGNQATILMIDVLAAWDPSKPKPAATL